MQPHVQRMITERTELSTKCDALLVFLSGEVFNSLPKEKKDLMHEQYAAMREYLDVLDKRISLE